MESQSPSFALVTARLSFVEVGKEKRYHPCLWAGVPWQSESSSSFLNEAWSGRSGEAVVSYGGFQSQLEQNAENTGILRKRW